ncbi:MAG: ROK family protein [Balneolaceae bacterium]
MSNTYIGVDLGGTNVRAGVISGNKITELVSEKIGSGTSGDEVLQLIAGLIRRLPYEHAEGIGFGVPSVVDTTKGIVYDVQNIPGWDEVPLKEIMEKEFSRPVLVNNDANCFALGEYHFGKGRSYDSLIALNIGTGFAGGIVLNGRLYEGRNCGAGEFGTIPYRKSILEHYCAGLFFQRNYGVSGGELGRRAASGDPDALEIFKVFGRHVGVAMQIILYSYDPQAIILGGSVSRSWRFFKESLFRELENYEYQNSLKNLVIDRSEIENIAVLGAAALIREWT